MTEERNVAIDRLALGWQVAAFLYGIAIAFVAPARYFPRVMFDDAAYYLRIARNAGAGHGFTFDRLHPTNGFQPLWQWLLVGLAKLVPGSPESLVRAAWCLQSVLFAAAAWILWRRLRAVAGSGAAALGMALLFHNTWYLAHSGMESALLLCVAALVLEAFVRARAGGPSGIPLGLAMGALMLSRLDSVFWVGALLLAFVLLGDAERRGRLRIALVAGTVCAVVVGAYLAFNLNAYGHWMPISGAIKTSFPKPGWYVGDFRIWGRESDLFAQTSLLAAFFLIARATPWARPWHSFWRLEATAAAAGTLAHHLYSALFMKWAVFSWHFTLALLFLALLVPFLVAGMMRRMEPRTHAIGWAAFCLLLFYGAGREIVKKDWREPERQPWTVTSWEAAHWVKANLPPDAVIGMKDAGNLGFYGERRVVDLDGIVNSWEYQEALRAGRFADFLRRAGATHFAQHAFWNQPEMTEGRYDSWVFESFSHLHDLPGGTLTLRRADEVYRSEPYWDGPHRTVMVLWRISP
jgi:hypothetical protein